MIIGEQPNERRNRETAVDERRRAAIQTSELTGEPIEYLDEFTYNPQDLAKIHWAMGRMPKGYKPKKK